LTLPETTGGEFVVTDSSGNVGIGTSSPANTLHVDGTLKIEGSIGTISTDSQGLTLDLNRAGTTGITNNNASGILTFGTATSERMRIDSSGNVGIGTTSIASDMRIVTQSLVNGDHHHYFKNTSGVGVGRITCTSSATSYVTSSDYRLKEDWQPMSGSIDRLKNLKPVNFAWKVDGSRVDGFLAHEAAEVVPEAVSGEKDAMRTEEYEVTPAVLDDDGNVVTEAVMGTREVPDYQGIDQAKLVPLLTAALQEAVAKIEALETRIAALEVTP
jgi:hypothetical protein